MDACTRLLAGLVKVGVNVNWLVFGQGEMFVVDRLETERLQLEAAFWQADSNLLRATLNLVFDQVSKEEGQNDPPSKALRTYAGRRIFTT